MICVNCRKGADIKGVNPLAFKAKRQFHDKCKGGTHCDCQHRIDRKNV